MISDCRSPTLTMMMAAKAMIMAPHRRLIRKLFLNSPNNGRRPARRARMPNARMT